MDRIELYGSSVATLAGHLGGAGRALAAWSRIREGVDPFEEGRLPGTSVRRLRERCQDVAARAEEEVTAADGTVKLLLRLRDGLAVETVLIPGRGRTTICLSTQVGCRRGCAFCVTATMGLTRSLSTAEIVAQVILARRTAERSGLPAVRNVVFMGMGEPLDNLDATLAAIDLLVDPRALALAPRHVTLSTVGTSPAAIRRLASTPVRLAWSVHCVDDALRRRLIPTSRHSMAGLREAFLDVVRERGATLFVEMTMLAGVNDHPEQAEALAAFLQPFDPPVRINLLPMNPGRVDHHPSPPDRVLAFRQRLRERGYFCALRQPRGADRSAACGQLAVGAGPR